MKNFSDSGLSLIELMIVVAIIGILAAVALPRFQTFMGKARQAEAKVNLNAIYTLQESYFGDNDRYAELLMDNPKLPFSLGGGSNNPYAGDPVKACNFDSSVAGGALGFNITDCQKMRYAYNSSVSTGGVDFVATASTVNFFATFIQQIFDFINNFRSNFGLPEISFPPTSINQPNPECDTFDAWTIDKDKKLENISDGVVACQ